MAGKAQRVSSLPSTRRAVRYLCRYSEHDAPLFGWSALLGLQKGEVVAMVMAPSPDAVLAGLGTARLGGIFMTLNTEFRRDYLALSLELSTARILIIDSDYAGRLLELESLGPIEHVFVKGTIPEGLNARPLEWLTDNDGSGPAGDVQPADEMFVW